MDESRLFQDQLLTTKFFVPESSQAVIPRARLFALLDEGLSRPLTLVSAPAGYGKSTLVATWVQSKPTERPLVAWVTLDEQDNDPLRFWSYVLTAFDRCQPGVFRPLLTVLRKHQFSPPSLLTALLNTLADHSEPLILILDDYQAITEATIHASLSPFIERLPPQTHMVLITRVDPPVNLSRLRGHNQVFEIRTDSLCCTPEETHTFLREVMGIQLEPDEAEQVTARTEGWLMGLQLVGLSLRGHDTPHALLTQLSGTQRYILDYLTEEVLQQQSTEIQKFLLQTSILAQLTSSLCDTVMGQAGSQQVLETLERANVFLVPLDGERRWYRYHALFAEALRTRLAQGEERHALPELHRRACDWYADHSYVSEAIEHALQAQDWPRAADLIELATRTLALGTSGSPSVLHWLRRLPAAVVGQHPRLCLFYARSLFLSAQFQEALAWLDTAEGALTDAGTAHFTQHEGIAEATSRSGLSEHERKAFLGRLLSYRAVIAGHYGESQTARSLSQQALSSVTDQDIYERASIASARALAALAEGEASTAVHHALEMSTLMQAADNVGAAVSFLCIAASLLHLQGQLQAAWQMYQDAIALGTGPENVPFTAVGLAYAYQADLLCEWNRLDEALDFALRGLHLAEQGDYTSVYLGRGYQALVRIYLSRGELDAAQATLEELLQLPLLVQNPYQQATLAAVEQVRLWVAGGEGERAVHWATGLDHKERSCAPLAYAQEEVALVRVCLLQKQAAEALTRLERVLERATAQQRWCQVIEARLLQALAYQVNQQEHEALSALAEVVRLAESEGYIRSFTDEGTPMETLLSSLRAQEQKQGPTPYLDTVLASFSSSALYKEKPHPEFHTSPSSPRLPHEQAYRLLDPLSEREQEVLRLLAQGASNQEIAEQLVVTAATVKFHVSHILSKLQARNRTQAVARARSLGLLSAEP
jgi:LuxR family transcriptional regulator, maltose regulon positive regulatory protein